MPDLLHVVPVGHDAVLDGVLEGEDASLGLGLVSDIRVLLSHSDHDSGVSGASDDRGKHCSGSVVSGESGLAHARTVVNDQSLNFFFAHFVVVGGDGVVVGRSEFATRS
jgi:hypothetical protein